MKRSRSNDEIDNALPLPSRPLPPAHAPLVMQHETSMDTAREEQKTSIQQTRRKCPYLDTVDRQHLDFDMEKVCSVTLSNMNIYACLVCGKFFQGRGQATPGPSPLLSVDIYLL
jgi:hypothetical protein